MSAPRTPFTGGEENSSMGLFFSEHPDTGEEVATIIVSLNEKVLSKNVRDQLDVLEKAKENDDLSLAWSVGFNMDGDADNSTTLNAMAFSLILSKSLDKEILVKEDIDYGEVYLESTAVIPISIALTWINYIYRKEIKLFQVCLIDGEAMIRDRHNLLDDNKAVEVGVGTAAKLKQLFNTYWTSQSVNFAINKKDLEIANSKIVRDVFFGNIPYPQKIMRLMQVNED